MACSLNSFCWFKSRSPPCPRRSEEHTSELQSRGHLVCRLLLEKKNHTTLATPSACLLHRSSPRLVLHSFPTRRSSDLFGVDPRGVARIGDWGHTLVFVVTGRVTPLGWVSNGVLAQLFLLV